MFNRVGDIASQHLGMHADACHGQQIFSAKHVGIEAVVQIDRPIATAALNPLGRPEYFGEPAHVRPHLWVVCHDVRSARRLQDEAMSEHIVKDQRHTLHIPYRRGASKLRVLSAQKHRLEK